MAFLAGGELERSSEILSVRRKFGGKSGFFWRVWAGMKNKMFLQIVGGF